MSDIERIDQRLSAVERAVVDGDLELDKLADLATLTEDLERLETRIEEHERRLADLEASVDAIDGYVGNVETVNEDVERQADAAIAAVDRLESRIDELEGALEAERNGGSDGGHREDATPSLVASADAEQGRANAAETAVVGTQSGAVSDSEPGRTAPTADGDRFDDEGPEEAVDELFAEADDSTDDEESDGGIQQTIKRRFAGDEASDSGGDDTDSSGGDDAELELSYEEGEKPESDESEADESESNGLFTSLRDRLP